MLESKNMVPKAYSKSRDYKAILKLLDLIICSAKSDCDNLSKIFNPMLCPIELLPNLASYVGYNYDINQTQYSNRLIIKYYQLLIRNRGSITGIKLAVSLAINAYNQYDINNTSLFDIYYDRSKNIIYIYIYSNNYIDKIYDLIEVVRPAGTRCEIMTADSMAISEQIDIYDNVTCVAVYNYNPEVLDSQTVNNFTISIGNYKLIIEYDIPNPEEKNGYVIVNDRINEGNYKFKTDTNGYIRGYRINAISYNDPINVEISTPYRINNEGDIIYENSYNGNKDNDNLYEVVMTKSYIDKFIITDRFKLGIRNRVSFGEVYNSNPGVPIIYLYNKSDLEIDIAIKDLKTNEVLYGIDNISKFIESKTKNYKYIKLANYNEDTIETAYDMDKLYKVELSINKNSKSIISTGDLYITILKDGTVKYSNISFDNIFNITGE